MVYLAAILIVGGVALFVAAPLTGGTPAQREHSHAGREAGRLEHERSLAVQGLREVEFDREMGKLSEADYKSLRLALENRALAAMSEMEGLRSEAGLSRKRTSLKRGRIEKSAPPASRMNFCPHCGTRVGAGHNFCAECGVALLGAAQRMSTWAE